jgi:hypothetical protein
MVESLRLAAKTQPPYVETQRSAARSRPTADEKQPTPAEVQASAAKSPAMICRLAAVLCARAAVGCALAAVSNDSVSSRLEDGDNVAKSRGAGLRDAAEGEELGGRRCEAGDPSLLPSASAGCHAIVSLY